jgi:hypothetical protein
MCLEGIQRRPVVCALAELVPLGYAFDAEKPWNNLIQCPWLRVRLGEVAGIRAITEAIARVVWTPDRLTEVNPDKGL